MTDPTTHLQEKIDQLAARIRQSEEELLQLQEELQVLRSASAPADSATDGRVRPAPAPYQGGLENFIGLRLIHIAGIIILVTGLSIGVKYAIDQQLISEAARIGLAYLAGALLYFFSWRLKQRYTGFSAILFSGAMASVYFTTYAAYTYYSLFAFPLAFGAMVGITFFTVYQAIRYNRQEIAILGMTGAYAIPFFISSNNESILLFFSYILLINTGVLFLAFRKKWIITGQLAMYCTWALLLAAAAWRYEEMVVHGGRLFMIIFYLLFLFSAVASRIISRQPLKAVYIQQVLVNNLLFGISAFVLLSGEGMPAQMVIGFLCLLLAGLAILTRFFFPEEDQLLQSLCMQAVAAAVLFVLMEWKGMVVTLVWIAMAVALFISGMRMGRSWPRMAAFLLLAGTLCKLVFIDSASFGALEKIGSYLLIGSLLLVWSFLYQKGGWEERRPGDRPGAGRES